MRADFIAGMPHLALGGLSENWLLKECGHHHWQLLAARYGRQVPDFKEGEDSAYAAFTSIRITELAATAIGENTAFSLHSELCAAGHARHYSRHVLRAGGKRCGTIEMLSAFVRRDRPGNNHRVHRARPGGMAANESAAGSSLLATAAAQFVEAGRQFRAGEWQRDGFRPDDRRALADFPFLPCPSTDFNGAGFLYCASFQSIVERAEWTWFRHSTPARSLNREIHFFGNLDVGDSVLVRLCGERQSRWGLTHWSEVVRNSDAKAIAQVITWKTFPHFPLSAADEGVRAVACSLGPLIHAAASGSRDAGWLYGLLGHETVAGADH